MSDQKSVGAQLDDAFARLATKDDVQSVKDDVASLKTDVSGLKTDVSGLKTDMSGLKSDMRRLEGLTLGLIDAVNANTESIETALNSAGVPVKLMKARK